MGVITYWFMISTLKISKSLVDVAQLAIILIKVLLCQSSNSLFGDLSSEDSGKDSDENWECFSYFGSFLGHYPYTRDQPGAV